MIEINLTPIESRKKRKKGTFMKGLNVPLEVIIGLGGGLLGLLLCVYVLLIIANLGKAGELMSLKKQWEQMQPTKVKIDGVLSELRSLQSIKSDVEKICTANRIVWSKKLNIIADLLTKGVWLTRMEQGEKILVLKGRAISKQNEVMSNIHAFVAKLKGSADFMADVKDVELGNILAAKVNTVDVLEFSIKVNLK
ncbi:MAG: PilN domain-containing protein [Candidatus Omnitrophica bacterium]|nr:PilN domain-containing protein [Candidatus Omnitrophota bacterium]